MPRAATLLGALGAGAALGVRLPAAAEQPVTPLTRTEAWWQRRHGARVAQAGARAQQWPETGSPAYGGLDGDFVYPPDLVFGNAATPTNPPPRPPVPTTTEMGAPWDYSHVDPITGLPKTHPNKYPDWADPDWPGELGGGADGATGLPGAGGETAGAAGLPGAGGEPSDAAGAPFPGGGGVGGAAGDMDQDVAGGTNPFGLPPAMTTTYVGQGGHVSRVPLNDYVIDQPNYIEEYTWPEFYKEVMDETSGTAEPIVEPPPPPTPMATTSHPTLTTQSPAHFGPGHYDEAPAAPRAAESPPPQPQVAQATVAAPAAAAAERERLEAEGVPLWLAQAASGAGAAEAETEARDPHGPAALLQLAAETGGGPAPPDALGDPGRDWVDEMMRRLEAASS